MAVGHAKVEVRIPHAWPPTSAHKGHTPPIPLQHTKENNMLDGMGFVVASGEGPLVMLMSIIAAIWNAAVLALWAGAITAGILVAKDLF